MIHQRAERWAEVRMREGNTQTGKWKRRPPEARNQWLSTQSGSGSAAAAILLPASAPVPDPLSHRLEFMLLLVCTC